MHSELKSKKLSEFRGLLEELMDRNSQRLGKLKEIIESCLENHSDQGQKINYETDKAGEMNSMRGER